MPSVAVVALVTLFAPFIAFQPAVAAEGDPDEPVLVQFEKDAIPPASLASVGPAETVTYQFTINCSSLTTDCLDLALTDTIPAPLVLQSVSTAQSMTSAEGLRACKRAPAFRSTPRQPCRRTCRPTSMA